MGGGGIQSPPALEAFTALARLAREGLGEVRVGLGRSCQEVKEGLGVVKEGLGRP